MKHPAEYRWVFALCLLILFGFLGKQLVSNAPKVTLLDWLEVHPGPGSVIIGHEALAQHPGARSADAKHLKINWEGDNIRIYNVSGYKKVDVKTSLKDSLLLKRRKLLANDVIEIGRSRFGVERLDSGTLVIQDLQTKRRVSWNGGRIFFDPNEPVYLDDRWRFVLTRWQKRVKWIFRTFVARDKEMFLWRIGGSINTADQWHVAGIPSSSVKIMYKAGAFFLAPGGNNRLADFGKTGLSLKGEHGIVQRLVMGRTYYDVGSDGGKLTLTPLARQDTWTVDQKIPKVSGTRILQRFKQLNWTGAGVSFQDWCLKHRVFCIAVLILSLFCCMAVFFHHQIHRRRFRGTLQPLGPKLIAVMSIMLTGLLTIQMQITGEIGMGTLLVLEWIAWAVASLLIMQKYKRDTLFGTLWIGCLFLCGFGTLFLVQLGAGAENVLWLSYGKKHIVLMTLFAVAIQILVLLDEEFLKNVFENLIINDHWIFRFIRIGLVFIAIGVMCLQLFFGGESGLWNFQPAEGSKLLFVIVAAFVGLHLGELRRHNSDLYQQNPLKYLYDIFKIFFLFCLALFVVLIGVQDISPVVIMGMLFLSWLWKISPHPWKPGPSHKVWRLIILTAVLFVLYKGYGFYSDPDGIPSWIPQKDRFQVWACPDKYPHSGAQVLKSMELAGIGGWTGAQPSWFGKNESVYRLPAVQDDFILGFILYKFGGITGLILALVQIFYVWTLLRISVWTDHWAENSGSFKDRQTGKVLSLIVFGLAWIHITQWAISWGNALGVLPIMGQPMTWISSANSHMVFIGFPAIVFAMVSSLSSTE